VAAAPGAGGGAGALLFFSFLFFSPFCHVSVFSLIYAENIALYSTLPQPVFLSIFIPYLRGALLR